MVSVFIFPVFVVCVIIAVAAAVSFAVIGTANSGELGRLSVILIKELCTYSISVFLIVLF